MSAPRHTLRTIPAPDSCGEPRQQVHAPARGRQRGSMAITMLLMMVGLIAMLGLIEVGYYYWAKRDTQKVADLAALSGAQQLPDCGNAINSADANAKTNMDASGLPNYANGSSCGYWDPATAGSSVSPAAGATVANAVKVVASMSAVPILGQIGKESLTVKSTAVAANTQPIAAFSVGTTLVAINGESTLGQLLRSVGIPLDGTSLIGYEGLANVNITSAGLLKQLGIPVDAGITVGGLNDLLAAHQVSVSDLLNAAVTVAGQQDLVAANADLLNAVLADVNVPGVTLQNVTLGGLGGLFATIVAPDGSAQAALNAQVNALQLISTAIGVGTGNHAIRTQTGILLGSLLNVTAATSVIEPPSIGIGGVGTKAYTAQIRTFIDISVDTSGVPIIGGLLNLTLHLPIAIDLVDAQGKLTDLCDTTDSTGQPQATIDVTSSVLKMCVGNITQANALSTVGGCDQIPGANNPTKLLGLSAADVNLLSLSTSFATNALPANGSATLSARQTAIVGNQLAIGTTVNNLFTALTAALITQPTPSSTSSQTATALWNGIAQGRNNALTYGSQFGTWRAQAIQQVQSSSQGLQGFLGSDVGQVSDILGNTLSLNVPGLLGGVGGLLNNVTGLLSGVLNGLLGTGCTPGLLGAGNYQSCISDINSAITPPAAPNGAFLSLLGFLVQALQQPLDDVGSKVLTPLLQNILGLDLGQTTVHLQSLQCHRVQLVY